MYDQQATKNGCHTNRVKEDRIPTRIEKPVRDTTRTRRHRHHHRHAPRKGGYGNQEAIEIEDIVTNKNPDNETARNGWKRRR